MHQIPWLSALDAPTTWALFYKGAMFTCSDVNSLQQIHILTETVMSMNFHLYIVQLVKHVEVNKCLSPLLYVAHTLR